MMYVVKDACEISAEFVEGLCYTAPKVLKRVNEAVRRLLQSGDYNHTIDQVNLCVENNSIALPREYGAVRLINMDGTPVTVESRNYQFVSNGPGGSTWDQLPKLIDVGMFPTFFNVPRGYVVNLWAASTSVEDQNKSITFRARSSNGAELLSSQGESALSLPIQSWVAGSEGTFSQEITSAMCSDDAVASLSSIELPEDLQGYVSLYAVEMTTQRMWFLSKYHPKELRPGYRRYRLPLTCTDGILVECLCKKTYVPATLLTDILLIQNLDAIKNMVIAIERENKGDVNGSAAYAQIAVGNLQLQQRNESKGERFTVNHVGHSAAYNVALR